METSQSREGFDDEIDLFELIGTIWSGKWLIIAVSVVAAAGNT